MNVNIGDVVSKRDSTFSREQSKEKICEEVGDTKFCIMVDEAKVHQIKNKLLLF
jgi:hypothetical protein